MIDRHHLGIDGVEQGDVSMQVRIGIITFQDSKNYGALLQSYALSCYLSQLGYKVEIIDYRNRKRRYAQVHGIRKIRSLFWAFTMGNILENRVRKKRTESFRELFLPLSEQRYISDKQLKDNPPDYDVYITGSDQVWNFRNTGGDLSYFLDFVPDGRLCVSYGPSFGSGAISDEVSGKISDSLSKIEYLSVREASGRAIIQEKFSRDAMVVCDPVFLLPRDKWLSVARTSEAGQYILCYYMPGDKVVEKKMRDISLTASKMLNLPLINIGRKDYEQIFFWKCKNTKYSYGPLEFVGAVANARLVITNSFHGAAFSVLFGKALVTPIRTDLPKEKALNIRIIEMLNTFGYQDSLIPCEMEISKTDLLKLSESRKSENHGREYIKCSMDFLNSALTHAGVDCERNM